MESVAAIRKTFPLAEIEAVLPRSGPIVESLAPHVDSISFEPLWVLRRRALPRLLALAPLELPLALWRAWRRFRRSDVVYVNTSVLIDYQIVARAFPDAALLHLHEIATGAAGAFLRGLARWSGAEILFNSRATRQAFAPLAGHLVYNGIRGPDGPSAFSYDGARPLRLLLLGRINRIKGQEVLLRALASMPEAARARFEVRMAGGAFENPALEQALAAEVHKLSLEGRVSVEPFVADTAPLYDWADIVVVPSQLPESLGRVAIEAMAHGRPVVASEIGGLKEVVDPGATGVLVPPADAGALSQALLDLLDRPSDLAAMGRAGRSRFEAMFSENAAHAALSSILTDKARRHWGRQRRRREALAGAGRS